MKCARCEHKLNELPGPTRPELCRPCRWLAIKGADMVEAFEQARLTDGLAIMHEIQDAVRGVRKERGLVS